LPGDPAPVVSPAADDEYFGVFDHDRDSNPQRGSRARISAKPLLGFGCPVTASTSGGWLISNEGSEPGFDRR
jgi:hypothetical protein